MCQPNGFNSLKKKPTHTHPPKLKKKTQNKPKNN